MAFNKKLGELYVEIRERGLAGVSSRLKGMKGVMSRVGMVWTRVAGTIIRWAKRAALAFAAMLAYGTRQALAFEKGLAMVNTMLDKQTERYLPQYARELSNLSVEYAQATGTLAKGLYDILSASVPAAKAMDVLEVSARFAVAGFTQAGTAADALTTVLNAYRMEASKAADVSDWMFAVVKKGKLTADELATSIGKVAAIASVAGIELTDLGATLATVTRGGLNAYEATTALRGIMLELLDPQEDARKELDKLGIAYGAAGLEANGLIGTIRQLVGLNAEMLKKIVPNRRALAGLAIAVKDVTGYLESYNYIANRTGATQEALEKVTSTTAFQWERLKQQFQAVLRTMGEKMMPALKGLAKWVETNQADIISFFTGLASVAATVARIIGQIAKALWVMLWPIRNLIKAMQQLGVLAKESPEVAGYHAAIAGGPAGAAAPVAVPAPAMPTPAGGEVKMSDSKSQAILQRILQAVEASRMQDEIIHGPLGA